MATPRNKTVQTPYPGSANSRSYYRRQVGWNGNKVDVYEYQGDRAFSRGHYLVNGNVSAMDAANAPSLSDFRSYSGIPPWARLGYNKAYARLREKVVKAEASLGAFFAELGEAAGMILNRINSLIKAYRLLRKGKVRKAFAALNLSIPQVSSDRRVAKDAAGWWLELWFGWLPSIGDIYNAAKVMCSEPGIGNQRGTATSRRHSVVVNVPGKTRNTSTSSIRHIVGAHFQVQNPNKLLLNQLGLANPVAVAWELIPFSFMLDWVFKIGDFINSYTDWFGLLITKPYHTHVLRYRDVFEFTLPLPAHITGGPQTGFGSGMYRGHGIPRPFPVYQYNGNLGTLLTRTASAVSILINLLLGGTKSPRM